MSVDAMSWAWKQNLPTGMKFTLVTLSNFADMEEGTCYPGQARLGSMTGQHANTIAKHLAVLEEDGYLTRERRINSKGHRTSDRYRLHLDRVEPESLPTETGGRDSEALTTPEAVPNHTPTLNPYPHPECGGTVREQPSVEPSGELALVAVSDIPPSGQSFEAFWKVYPRKRGMGTAERAWAKAVKTTPGRVIIEDVVRRLPWFEQEKANPRGDMRPYPGTWLNDKRWTDEVESVATVAEWRPAPDADELMAKAAAERASAGPLSTPESRAKARAAAGITDPRKTRREWSAG